MGWFAGYVEQLIRDARVAGRGLARSPLFTLIVVACLAIGIGANAAVYSWMDGVLVHPYPGVAEQSRLVAVAGTVQGSSDVDDMSWPDYDDLRTGARAAFSSFVASKITGATITGGDRADRVVGMLVSTDYFDALGVRLLLGAGFPRSADVADRAHPVVVISYRVWRDRFRGDPAVLGRTLAFNGVAHTIVGVTPREFLGTFVGYAMQFWVPLSQQAVFNAAGYRLPDRGARWVEGFARLAPGVSLERAQTVVSAIGSRLSQDHPDVDRGRGVRLFALWDSPFDNAKELRPMLRVMSVVGALVLLIVCANAANLLFVRSLTRQHEMTVRLAIGARRATLVRQILIEGVTLAALGTVVGLGLAYVSRNVLGLFFAPRGGAMLVFAGSFDWRVVAVTVGVGALSTLLFALAPALQASSVDLAAALKCDSRLSTGGKGRGRVRYALVALQVCSSYVLLVVTGLLLLSLARERSERPGFATDGVVTTTVNLFGSGYDSARARRFYDELLPRVRDLPGVAAVALSHNTPFATRPYDNGAIAVDGYTPGRDERPTADYDAVTPGYFAALSIPVLAGREFTAADADTTRAVVIVSTSFASKFWPHDNALGRRVQLNGRWMDVVGIVKDIKHRTLLKPATPVLYVALSQNVPTAASLFVRTRTEVASGIVSQIHALDPNVSPYEILPLREQVARSTAPQQTAAALVGLFACVALFLAAIGLYGVIAYVVSQSARELSLRLAIGASPVAVIRMVVGRGLRFALVGSLAGTVIALTTTRLLGDLLFRVNPRDPAAIAGAFAVMIAVAAIASLAPAWRAGRSDPAAALRT
jgi:putative ABC transport system permease protein